MKSKIITILSLSIAVVALSAALAVRSVKRAEKERFAAESKASEAEIAIRTERKAEADRKAAEAAARAKASEAEKAKAESARALAEQKAQSHAAALAAAEQEKSANELAKAKELAKSRASEAEVAKANAAVAASEAEKAAAEAEKARAAAEIAKAKAEAEKAKLDAFVAEAKALELRKIDFETAVRELSEFKQELDERERLLRPEKTSADLTWVGEREPDEIGGTNAARRVVRKTIRPEDDPALPHPSRALARCEREIAARSAELSAASSNAVVSTLERLFVKACEEDRVIDADFYARSIRLMYPQWVYRPPEAKKECRHDK